MVDEKKERDGKDCDPDIYPKDPGGMKEELDLDSIGLTSVGYPRVLTPPLHPSYRVELTDQLQEVVRLGDRTDEPFNPSDLDIPEVEYQVERDQVHPDPV